MMEYDLSTLLPLLGNLGAPLSVSVMLFYLMYRQQRAMNEALQRTLTIIELLALDNCRESLAEEEATADVQDSPVSDSTWKRMTSESETTSGFPASQSTS